MGAFLTVVKTSLALVLLQPSKKIVMPSPEPRRSARRKGEVDTLETAGSEPRAAISVEDIAIGTPSAAIIVPVPGSIAANDADAVVAPIIVYDDERSDTATLYMGQFDGVPTDSTGASEGSGKVTDKGKAPMRHSSNHIQSDVFMEFGKLDSVISATPIATRPYVSDRSPDTPSPVRVGENAVLTASSFGSQTTPSASRSTPTSSVGAGPHMGGASGSSSPGTLVRQPATPRTPVRSLPRASSARINDAADHYARQLARMPIEECGHCWEIVKTYNGMRQARGKYGVAGANNPNHDFSGRAERTYEPDVAYVVAHKPSRGVAKSTPLVFVFPAQVVDKPASPASTAGSFIQNELNPELGYGEFNMRCSIAVRMVIELEDAMQLFRTLGNALGLAPVARSFDLTTKYTIHSRTYWLDMTSTAEDPRLAMTPLDPALASVGDYPVGSTSFLGTFARPDSPLSIFQPVFDGRNICTPEDSYFRPDMRHGLPILNLEEDFVFKHGDLILMGSAISPGQIWSFIPAWFVLFHREAEYDRADSP
ncbi:hypothetical protein HDU96_009848, partial [Phlyctochytrium bullatum]